jgi:small-conductance mechanosensitive channel
VTVQGVELHQSVSTTPMQREALAEVVAMRDVYEDLFRQVISQGTADGLFADIDPSLAAKGILGSLNWITVWYRPRETEAPDFRERVASQLSSQVVFGVKGGR